MKTLTKILDQHEIICWDVDSTLINGRNSHFFQEYVVKNPHKSHHIVTFRSDPIDIHNLSRELYIPHKNFSIKLFKSVKTMPQSISIDNINTDVVQDILSNINHYSEEYIKKHTGDTKQELLNRVNQCNHFKANACIEVGSKILIDDLYSQLLPSFQEKKLILIDSLCQLY